MPLLSGSDISPGAVEPFAACTDEPCSCGRGADAGLVDGRVAHVLDDPLAVRNHHDVQHNELMAPAFKAFFYSAAHGKLISIPGQIEMTEFASVVSNK